MSRWLKRIGVSTIALSCVVGPAEAGPMLARVKSNSTAAIDKAASGKSVGELSGTPAQSGATPMNGGGSTALVTPTNDGAATRFFARRSSIT